MDSSMVAVLIFCIWKDFHSGVLKLFQRNLQGIKLRITITYSSLINIICDNFFQLICLLYTHVRVRLMNLCGICDL